MKAHRLVFPLPELKLAIHATPKCAATSIRNACLRVLGVHVPAEADGQKEAWPLLRHTSEIPPDHHFVLLVRHPVERVIAAWANKAMDPDTRINREMREAGVRKGMSFARFASLIWVGGLNEEAHTCRQVAFLPFGRPTNNRVIKFEQLAEGWEALRRDYPALPSLPRSNPSPPLPPGAIDAESVAVLNDHFAADMKAFGYEPLLTPR